MSFESCAVSTPSRIIDFPKSLPVYPLSAITGRCSLRAAEFDGHVIVSAKYCCPFAVSDSENVTSSEELTVVPQVVPFTTTVSVTVNAESAVAVRLCCSPFESTCVHEPALFTDMVFAVETCTV